MARTLTLARPLHWLGLAVAWLLIVSVGAMLVVALVVPRLGGATPYVIETGSMRPGMPPGTLVVVRPAPVEKIGVGDVVTYQLKSGDPTVVTHRVVALGVNGEGRPQWRTQGDANDTADQSWVLPVQVKGVRWYAVPYLGYATSFITEGQRSLLTVLVVAGLFGYAAAMFRGAWLDRRRALEPVPRHLRAPVPEPTLEPAPEPAPEPARAHAEVSS